MCSVEIFYMCSLLLVATHYQACRVCQCVVCNQLETMLDATVQLFLGDQAVERRWTSRQRLVSGKYGGTEVSRIQPKLCRVKQKKKNKAKKMGASTMIHPRYGIHFSDAIPEILERV